MAKGSGGGGRSGGEGGGKGLGSGEDAARGAQDIFSTLAPGWARSKYGDQMKESIRNASQKAYEEAFTNVMRNNMQVSAMRDNIRKAMGNRISQLVNNSTISNEVYRAIGVHVGDALIQNVSIARIKR